MAVLSAGFGQGSGPISLRGIGCTGFESELANCSNDGTFPLCTHSNDAGVRCLSKWDIFVLTSLLTGVLQQECQLYQPIKSRSFADWLTQ